MCLYPRVIRNPKYLPNKKNGGVIPPLSFKEAKYISIPCGVCIECCKRRANDWYVRLAAEFKEKQAMKFITLTFDPKKNKPETNEEAKEYIRKFLERWRKKYGKSIKHWLITEKATDDKHTKHLHFHGFLFTDIDNETIEKIWGYGYVYIAPKMSEAAIRYCVKYCLKPNREFKGKIFSSPGLGKPILKFKNKEDYFRLSNGSKIALPKYIRDKRFSENEREALFVSRIRSGERYCDGVKYNLKSKDEAGRYWRALDVCQQRNIAKGYGKPEKTDDINKHIEFKNAQLTLLNQHRRID